MIEYINQHEDDIRNHQQKPIKWWINRTGKIYEQIIKVIEPNEEKKDFTLTRDKIVEYYKQDLYRGFIATMLWGGKNKNGLETIIRQERDGEDGLEKKLCRVKKLLQQGKIREAFISMCKGEVSDKTQSNYIEQVGPAFFTKVFYFMSKAFPPKDTPIPLILDSHMMYIHCALLLEEQAKQSYYKWYKPKKGKEGIDWRKQNSEFVADAYINYINKMHIISQEINCSTDALESYLFDLKPGKKGSSIYQEVKEKIEKTVKDDSSLDSIIMIPTINANSSQKENTAINSVSALDFQRMTHNHGSDHVVLGYTFTIKDLHFWLFVAYEYENPRDCKKRRGYYCELLNQTNSTDITEILEVAFIFNKYRSYGWLPTKGKKYKYVFFGRKDTNKKDALRLMKSILKDINAPLDILNSIES